MRNVIIWDFCPYLIPSNCWNWKNFVALLSMTAVDLMYTHIRIIISPTDIPLQKTYNTSLFINLIMVLQRSAWVCATGIMRQWNFYYRFQLTKLFSKFSSHPHRACQLFHPDTTIPLLCCLFFEPISMYIHVCGQFVWYLSSICSFTRHWACCFIYIYIYIFLK